MDGDTMPRYDSDRFYLGRVIIRQLPKASVYGAMQCHLAAHALAGQCKVAP